MRTIGFVGAYDKLDLIIYVSKLLATMNKRVLIIDGTILQKSRYVVPTISPSDAYITEFEGIDIAVGFNNYESIKAYLQMPTHAVFDYDYIFLDVDNLQAWHNFDIKSASKNYFVTGFDLYSLKKGLEILSNIEEPVPFTKVLFSRDILKQEEEHFNYLALGCKAIWNEEKIYFPFDQGDQSVIIENQRVAKIKLKNLTKLYKESLMYIALEMIDMQEESALKRAFKQVEKGV